MIRFSLKTGFHALESVVWPRNLRKIDSDFRDCALSARLNGLPWRSSLPRRGTNKGGPGRTRGRPYRRRPART